jgi:opacity protein-like surface antigen
METRSARRVRVALVAVAATLSLAAPGAANADEPVAMPLSGFYIGFGGSYNATNLNQDLTGISRDTVVSIGGIPVATGQAGGPAAPFDGSGTGLAPEGQLGYFSSFGGSPWLWGFKGLYQYLDLAISDTSVVPQTGLLTTTIFGVDAYVGNIQIAAARTQVNHELAFMPFIGHAFSNGFLYAGAGPVLFNVETNIDNVIGYADVNGVHTNFTGAPVSFSGSNWVWGGAVQIGATYFLTSSWFIDLNYTYARTGEFTQTFSAPFSSVVPGVAGFTTAGTANVTVSDEITTQTVNLSINTTF